MNERSFDVVVAGHVCLDLIPRFENSGPATMGEIIVPGKLVNIRSAAISTGGAVSNTGLALIKLGVKTMLMGKIGDDFFAEGVRARFREWGPDTDQAMTVVPGEDTSYSIVLAPPGIDRAFLHCPGANNTFSSRDINYDLVAKARLFHLGYPPLMRELFTGGGAELLTIYRRVKDLGVTTSIDMTLPDQNSESGRVEWATLLEKLLPYVDIAPLSAEEAMFMLNRPRFDELKRCSGQGAPICAYAAEEFEWIARKLLELGAAIAPVKCGHRGMLLCTAAADRIKRIGAVAPQNTAEWADRALWEEPFLVDEVASTVGAGDSAIAGFLAAMLRGCGPEHALKTACCVGGQNVKVFDAVSGIHDWDQTQAMIADWPKRRQAAGDSWLYDEAHRVWKHASDKAAFTAAARRVCPTVNPRGWRGFAGN